MNCPHCHQPIALALVVPGEAPAAAPAPAPVRQAAIPDPGVCPNHRTPWTVKPAGVSKAGKAYAAFHKCDGKNPDGTYCGAKPDFAWVKAHPAAAPAGNAPEEW